MPYPELVERRFEDWLVSQQVEGVSFTQEQLAWLLHIKDHVAAAMSISPDDFQYTPFVEQGGLGRAVALFGDELTPLLAELNEALVA